MPKKNLIFSNGDGKTTQAPSSSATYDTDTTYVGVSDLSASKINLSGANNTVLTVSGGVIQAFTAVGNIGKYLMSDGTVWTSALPTTLAAGTVDADLSGSYPNPSVKSLSNVQTGSLKIAYGGFSGSNYANILDTIPSGNLIIAGAGNTLTIVSTASATDPAAEYVLASNSGSNIWAAVTASAEPRDINVQYYLCSASNSTSTYTWTKQNPNHIWARVMLQAGGGAGVGSGTTVSGSSGAGGGAGGFSDFTMFVSGISSATVVVGAGGIGTTTFGVAAAGSDTYFSGSGGLYLRAVAGTGGSSGVGGNGGAGFTFYGSDGGSGSATATGFTAGLDSAGASGGGGGGWNAAPPLVTGKAGGTASSFLNPITGSVASSGSYRANLFGYTVPFGFGTGGSGGTTNNLGYDGVFGGGGGGAGSYRSAPAIKGGNGGDGFAIIVSY